MPAKVEIPDLGRRSFRIGEWLIEPSLNRVSRGDTTIQLELKVMDVLVCLAERAGEVVTRIEIVDRVWATEFIADNTLTHAINEIRTALGDDARNPTFIETIHRRGYRLMVPVTLEERPAGTVAQFTIPGGNGCRRPPQPLPRPRRLHRGRRRVLLRPRGRGGATVAKDHKPSTAGGDRSIGSRQELFPAGWSDPRQTRRLERPSVPARRGAARGAGAGPGTGVQRATARRSPGSCI